MDQIGKQRDAVRGAKDADLDQRGDEENDEADRNRPDALMGAGDGRVDEPMRMPMPSGAVVRVLVRRSAIFEAAYREPALVALTGSGKPSRMCSTW